MSISFILNDTDGRPASDHVVHTPQRRSSMAPQMRISFILNDTDRSPLPRNDAMSIESVLNSTATYEEVWTGAAWEWKLIHYASNFHNIGGNGQDALSRLTWPVNGSDLVQRTHRRSPYGPDYPYLHRPYPEMDGLLYQFGNGPVNAAVGGFVQHSQQDLVAGQTANDEQHILIIEDAPGDLRGNDENRNYDSPTTSFQGTGIQNDPIMLVSDTTPVGIDNGPASITSEALPRDSLQQTPRWTFTNEERHNRTILPSNRRAGNQVPFTQTVRYARVEELSLPFRRINNSEGPINFEDAISNATQPQLDAFSHQEPVAQLPGTAGQRQPQNACRRQARSWMETVLSAPESALKSSPPTYQPNGTVHKRGGDKSMFCPYAFVDTPPASSTENEDEDEDVQFKTTQRTGIYHPAAIELNRKRKLDQISAGLDEFQLPIEAREGYAIDPITGRERKLTQRMGDESLLSLVRILYEQQRLKQIYEEERAEREEQDDSDSPSAASVEEARARERLPPGWRLDYFTKQPRKLRAHESRELLRRRFDRMVEKPAEERQWGYWEEGDSEMELSEWEEANRKPARQRRARKEALRRRILKEIEQGRRISASLVIRTKRDSR